MEPTAQAVGKMQNNGEPRRGGRKVATLVVLLLAAAFASAQTDPQPLDKVLERTSQRVSEFLDQFSNVKCTEQVTQEKYKPNGKMELMQQSTYDYLVILTNAGGDLSLNESRLPVKEAKVNRRQDVSMLLSNGFATLFLVFHPYYFNNFEFADAGAETVDGHAARRIHFQHISNTRSVAALALRGREYPLELSGTAWVDPDNGNILRLEAGIASTLEDIGMKTLQSSVRFAPVAFSKEKDQPVYWFPTEAVVEVETPKQHWRNTHHFSTYKQFSVTTEEHVAQK
jgi:outer membrane lipoprotein-sorting protein